MIAIVSLFVVAIALLAAAFACRNERFAAAFDRVATLGARTIGTAFGVALAIVIVAIYSISTPVGRVMIAVFGN